MVSSSARLGPCTIGNTLIRDDVNWSDAALAGSGKLTSDPKLRASVACALKARKQRKNPATAGSGALVRGQVAEKVSDT